MHLLSGGPGTLGYNLDAIGASAIYLFIGFIATILFFSKDSLKEKFKLMALPLSILFVGLTIGILARSVQGKL